jgi:chitodextrinase
LFNSATILSASVTTSTSTNLSWSGATDNVAVTGYDVYRGASLIGTVSTTSFGVTGLVPFTTYSFTIRAKDAAGNMLRVLTSSALDGYKLMNS